MPQYYWTMGSRQFEGVYVRPGSPSISILKLLSLSDSGRTWASQRVRMPTICPWPDEGSPDMGDEIWGSDLVSCSRSLDIKVSSDSSSRRQTLLLSSFSRSPLTNHRTTPRPPPIGLTRNIPRNRKPLRATFVALISTNLRSR